MNKIVIFFFFLLIFSCSSSTQDDDISCENRAGYLSKDNQEFACPFAIQKKVGYKNWIDIRAANIYVLDYDMEDNFPLHTWFMGGWPTYGVSMKVPKSHFSKEQYSVSLKTLDKNLKACGESREFIFHRVEENDDSVIYHSILKENYENSEDGRELFFGERDMSSYDWYQVLKVCGDKENGFSFILSGEIVE
jgi:hypothetical protein